MDQPDLDERCHAQALRGLERINSWSGSARILWPPLLDLARESGGRVPRVLDIATGGGDVPMRLWCKARRAGVPVSIEGCDLSPCAVDYARQQARVKGCDVRFFQLDASRQALPTDYDVLISSLFLHHLDDDQAVEFLCRMARAARRMVLINDLCRGRTGLLLAYVGTRLLSRSPVVHVDGPQSVRAAFTLDECNVVASKAGLEGVTIEKRWPCRFLLAWRRP